MSDFSTAISRFVAAIIRQRDERLRAGAWLEGDLKSAEALQAWNAAVMLGDAVQEAYAIARRLAPDAGARGEVVAAMREHQGFMAADSNEVDDIAFGGAYGEAVGLLTHYCETPETSADTEKFLSAMKSTSCGTSRLLAQLQWEGVQAGQTIDTVNLDFRKTHSQKLGKTAVERDKEWGRVSKAARRIWERYNRTE